MLILPSGKYYLITLVDRLFIYSVMKTSIAPCCHSIIYPTPFMNFAGETKDRVCLLMQVPYSQCMIE